MQASCGSCPRKWTGVHQAHCSSCHEHFSTVKNFDLHKPGPKKKNGQPTCGKPGEQKRKKRDGTVVPLLKAVEFADGITWVTHTDDPRFAEADS